MQIITLPRFTFQKKKLYLYRFKQTDQCDLA